MFGVNFNPKIGNFLPDIEDPKIKFYLNIVEVFHNKKSTIISFRRFQSSTKMSKLGK
jgi:hypothetical protein